MNANGKSVEFHSETAWRSEALSRGLQIGTSQKTGETVAYATIDGKTIIRGRLRKIGQDGHGNPTAIQGWLTD